MLAACALMVLGRERMVLLALAPGVVSAGAFLALGRPSALEPVVWVALASTPVLGIAFALAYTTTSERAGGLVAAAELPGAAARLAFGFLAPALIVLPVVTGLSDHRGDLAVTLVAIPLSLSMGAAEWSVSWYRWKAHRLLRATSGLGSFGRRARLAVLWSLAQYLAAISLLTGLAVAVAHQAWSIGVDESVALALLAFVALGGALFVAQLLHAFDRCWVTVRACAAALVCELALHRWGTAVQVAVYIGLLTLLGAYAAVILGRAAVHAH
jgi:hypothetical protein